MRCAYSFDLKSDSLTMTGFGENAAAILAIPSLSFATKNSTGSGYPAICSRMVAFRSARSPSKSSRGVGMHADHPVNDKFEACEPDTVIRYAGEVESPIRIADVHHYPGPAGSANCRSRYSAVRSSADRHKCSLRRPSAQDTVTISPSFSLSVASPHPTTAGRTEFAGDYRCVTGTAAAGS